MDTVRVVQQVTNATVMKATQEIYHKDKVLRDIKRISSNLLFQIYITFTERNDIHQSFPNYDPRIRLKYSNSQCQFQYDTYIIPQNILLNMGYHTYNVVENTRIVNTLKTQITEEDITPLTLFSTKYTSVNKNFFTYANTKNKHRRIDYK